jgi:2-polyprenyl-3-methyl-5-hydroxy-6-metoxy-1,4-benzoquinol methylase
LKKAVLKILMKFGLYPHIRFTYSPFKILEFQEMLNRVDFRGDERTLDIGCGDGLHTLLLGEHVGHITGIDVNSSFVADARNFAAAYTHKAQADFRDQPLEDIAFENDHFDLVFSICVIEHITNHEEVLRECLRIMKPGAKIVFTVDTLETIEDEALIRKHRNDHHVVRYFRQDSLRELLTGIGFEVHETQNLFRSDLARDLFTRGIRQGFNFGRFRCTSLARELAVAEAAAPRDAAGTFLLAVASKPGS